MKQNRADRVIAELKKQGVTQMLITDPMSVYYLTDVYVQPMERFYALLLKENGDHIFFLNHLFSVPEVTGVQQVWSYDTDPVMDIVAEFIDRDAPLGVDKDLKARFLLPLMEMQAAQSFVNTSVAVDTARGVKDEEEQEKMRVSSDLNDRAMAEFKKLIREGITEREVADQISRCQIQFTERNARLHLRDRFFICSADRLIDMPVIVAYFCEIKCTRHVRTITVLDTAYVK